MIVYLIIGTLALCVWAFYKWTTINYAYFAARAFPHIKPYFLLGTSGPLLLQLEPREAFIKKIYNAFPVAKIVGMFDFRQPMYMLRDPQLIKHMLVKDFDHFEDHKLFFDPQVDEMFGNSLIMMHGQRWRDMRANLSPAFTGSKMRLMFDMVNESAVDLVATLREKSGQIGASRRTDVKDLFGRYAIDVIATTAFGIQINSVADESNQFYVNGKRVFNFKTWRTALKMVSIFVAPKLMRRLGVQIMDADVVAFFRDNTLNIIRTRLEANIYRPDLLNLLMQLKRNDGEVNASHADDENDSSDVDGFAAVEESHIGQRRVKRRWTDNELVAQCIIFFAAGFDTTASTLSFLAYELALNPDVQQTLLAECRAIRRQLAGEPLCYDILQRMTYMDQVVSETLRMWPPAMITDRKCNRDYTFDDGELQFEVKRGWSLWIPIFALHRDEKYFPEADRFRPERFSDERKADIVPGTYIPFGVGPRNCIGSRFALMEIKALMYHIILSFNIEPTTETPIPMRLGNAPGATNPARDIILALKPRKE